MASAKPSPMSGRSARAAARASGGSGSGGGATVTTSPDLTTADRNRALATARKILGPDATTQDIGAIVGAPSNATVRVDAITDNKAYLYVNSPEFKAIRTITRTRSGDLLIENVEIKVFKAQGGLGTKIFSAQVEAAARMGAKKIIAIAAKSDEYVGYKVWPKLGYDADIPAQIRFSLPAEFRGARRISDLMKTAEGTKAWETYGNSTAMEFDLTPGSYSRKTLDAYVKAKGYRK